MSSSTSSLLGGEHSEARDKQWLKKRVRVFLESRLSHIIIITLVAVDTVLVLAELYIELFSCEELEVYGRLRVALPAVSAITLAISTIFMVELFISVYGFGLAYFGYWLRLLDAVVIIGSLVGHRVLLQKEYI
ncbi:hypothetical protein V1515DRAFT_611071 [Lipomyces mesembrius]